MVSRRRSEAGRVVVLLFVVGISAAVLCLLHVGWIGRVDSRRSSPTIPNNDSHLSLSGDTKEKQKEKDQQQLLSRKLTSSGLSSTASRSTTTTTMTTTTTTKGSLDKSRRENGIVDVDYDGEDFFVQELRQRMRPRDLIPLKPPSSGDEGNANNNNNGEEEEENVDIAKHQFVHLHHMKTGGTSINSVLKCAVDRARPLFKKGGALAASATDSSSWDPVPFTALSECSHRHYIDCISGKDRNCLSKIHSSSVMEFCAPLFTVNSLGWQDADTVTVLRHPLDRVWSMFRFQTKACYKCMPLLQVYKHIEEGTTNQVCGSCEGVCIDQLTNHQTRNLLTSDPSTRANSTDQDLLEEALDNLRHRFVVVGITEELGLTAKMIGKVFPWMADELDELGSNGMGDPNDVNGGSGQRKCSLPHANASPRNNRCGPGGEHWDLPDHPPDKETVEAILRHNQLDLQLYEAAVRHFELQKRALGLFN